MWVVRNISGGNGEIALLKAGITRFPGNSFLLAKSLGEIRPEINGSKSLYLFRPLKLFPAFIFRRREASSTYHPLLIFIQGPYRFHSRRHLRSRDDSMPGDADSLQIKMISTSLLRLQNHPAQLVVLGEDAEEVGDIAVDGGLQPARRDAFSTDRADGIGIADTDMNIVDRFPMGVHHSPYLRCRDLQTRSRSTDQLQWVVRHVSFMPDSVSSASKTKPPHIGQHLPFFSIISILRIQS